MRKFFLFICISVASLFIAFAPQINAATTENKLSNKCVRYRNDSATLRRNPGFYYYRIALECDYKKIHNKKSFLEVVALLKKSSINFFPPSYFVLGRLYNDKYAAGKLIFGAKGVPNDLLLSIKYYTKASASGSSFAQKNLAEIYFDGAHSSLKQQAIQKKEGDVKHSDEPIRLPDISKAIYWLTRASKNGNPFAQDILSDLYKRGFGVAQDYVRSYAWLNLSIASRWRTNQRGRSNISNISSQIISENRSDSRKERDKLYQQLTENQKDQALNLSLTYEKRYLTDPTVMYKICVWAAGYIDVIFIRKTFAKLCPSGKSACKSNALAYLMRQTQL